MQMQRHYDFVGPESLSGLRRQPDCLNPTSAFDIGGWLKSKLPSGRIKGGIYVTFIIDVDEQLWIADRCSEHVACADGGPVLAAGEMVFDLHCGDVEVIEVSNQSTGFCPEPSCWDVIARVLDRLRLVRPEALSHSFDFRRCPSCQAINVIKNDIFECDICGEDLPCEWNFAE
jgi:hypothetical protein